MATLEPTAQQIKNRELDSGMKPTANFRELDAPKVNTAANALESYLTDNPLATTEKTLMEKFAQRKKLASEAATANEALIKSQAGTAIEEQTASNERTLTSEMESRRGFATNTAVVRQIQDSGAKRVRELEKTRDELLLQNKVAEASRIDSLISDEQTAVTEARRSWISDMLNLGREKREVASFETPEQRRAAELQTKAKEAVLNLQSSAPDAGILATDDYNTAIEKYRNSGTYKRNQKKGELEIQQIQASINASNAAARKAGIEADNARMLSPAALGGKIGEVTTQSLSNAFDNAVQYAGSQYKTDESKRKFASYLQSGDIEQAKTYLKNMVKSSVDQNTKDQLNARDGAIAALSRFQTLLNEYKAQGGETGILKGSLESVANKLGRTTDPKLASIATEIKTAVQNYRKAISGAAFSEQEAAEYKSIFPSFFATSELNDATIEGALNAFKANQAATYGGVFGPGNYEAIFGVETLPVTGGQNRSLGSTASPSMSGNLFSSFFGTK